MSFSSVLRYSVKFIRPLTSQVYATSAYTSGPPIFESALNNDVGTNDMPVEMENPFIKDKPKCILCKMNITPDFKNTKLLSQFVSPFTGRVYGRHITKLCKLRQEQVEREIMKARNAGFMPYMNKEVEFIKDPKLFNPEKPLRNHDFC